MSRRAFKAKTRVRIPLGTPAFSLWRSRRRHAQHRSKTGESHHLVTTARASSVCSAAYGKVVRCIGRSLVLLAVLAQLDCSGSPGGPSSGPTPNPTPTPQPVTIAVSACPSAPLVGVALDIGFYQQIGCNAFDGPTQPVRRWMVAPKLYIRTVDDAGAAIDAVTLDTVQNAMTSIAPQLAGGKFGLASVERGTGTKEGVSGYVTVRWTTTTSANVCAQSDVAKDGGDIEFHPYVPNCDFGCGVGRIRPRTAKHELGHAFGYWHTDSPGDLMNGLSASTSVCDAGLSAREQQAVAYQYR
jgi:hypothetical protein